MFFTKHPCFVCAVQEREGRWWWEESAAKECGLHSGNVVGSSEAAAAGQAPDLFTDGARSFVLVGAAKAFVVVLVQYGDVL